ncbi:hypothetical protein OYC64_009873 [Pagothenia borchgrevinki]|uniref:Uncharacterized protein n=1 Tax=Pagothenia borchgrevinki TaxID=8213 RepID=A0ABD2H5Y0_PAGBO
MQNGERKVELPLVKIESPPASARTRARCCHCVRRGEPDSCRPPRHVDQAEGVRPFDQHRFQRNESTVGDKPSTQWQCLGDTAPLGQRGGE